ncbi:hypothetical protein ACJ73_07040, partial [Blastomyces percursus]
EFEESRIMTQDADAAIPLCPRRESPKDAGDSAHNNMGNENIPPHSSGIAPRAVQTTGKEDSDSKTGGGYQPVYSPRGRNFSMPVLKPDQPEIKNRGDLIDLSGQDKKPSDLDIAVEALIQSIRKRAQQGERPRTVNPAENSTPSTSRSAIPHQVKNNNGHDDVKVLRRMQTAQPQMGMNEEKTRNVSDEASPDSSVSTRFHTPQSENSDRVKMATHSETKQSGRVPIAGPKNLGQYHQASEPTQQEISGVRIVCFECETTFSTIIGLHHHQIMYEHNYCKLCLSFFNDRSLFQRHIQLMHNFKCIKCKLTYTSWEERGEHQRLTGHGYCKDCSSYFLDKDSYAKHLTLHKSTKFACPIYKASFATEESRNMHQSATKHAFCDECGRGFRDQESRSKHVNVHKAVNFACPTCGAGFITGEGRDTHQREYNHGVCSRCDRVFADSASEKSHNGVAHKHKCPEAGCKLSFPTSGLLETHKAKSHHMCILCDRKFVDRLALLTHERTSGKHAKKGATIA